LKKIKNIFLVFFLAFIFSEDSLDHEIKNPDVAWKLSLIPGLGQFYNEDYLKGTIFFASEVYLLSMVSYYYGININKRNLYAWLSLMMYTINIVDAYIDAELSTFFNLRTNIKDNK
tara:strand:- start:260 stop:607 length:348 start_codon:yes stop_codon:yes gene_type:complete